MTMIRMTVMTLLALIVLASPVLADADKDEYKKHPGYVDFEALADLNDEEAKVEVYLREPLIKLISSFMKEEDPELFDILRKLKLVRVQVFDVDSKTAQRFSEKSSATAKRLDSKGWERIVRVREDGEHIDVYLKPSEDYEWIQGIVIMVIGNDDEAVFVNIVGDIRPEDISRLGEHFDIDELDDIDYKKHKRKKRKDG